MEYVYFTFDITKNRRSRNYLNETLPLVVALKKSVIFTFGIRFFGVKDREGI